MPLLEQAHIANTPILREANCVMYCGEAKKVRRWLEPVESADRAKSVVHPDVRNKNNPRTLHDWKQVWTEGAIGKALALVLPTKLRLETSVAHRPD
jgi:type II secretory pathway component PulL